MRLTYPRLIGVLAAIWTPILQRDVLAWDSEATRLAFLGAWVAVTVLLVLNRMVAPPGAGLTALAAILFLWPGDRLGEALAMFVWVGVIIAVTEGRDEERALLVRVMVTTVYAFAALTKLNPSFLSGEQLIALSLDRSQLEPFESMLRAGWAQPLSFGVIALEGWLAVGLWIRRTRVPTIVVGAVAHVAFVLGAHNGTVWDVAFVTVLNGTLVVSYLAFLAPTPAGVTLMSRRSERPADVDRSGA